MDNNNIFFVPNKFAPDPIFFDPIPVLDPLPPVWLPIKDPKPLPGPGDGTPPAFRSFDYFGVVRGAYTEQPLPGATVSLYTGRILTAQKAADNAGRFDFSTDQPATTISISHATHKPYSWPASEVQHTFDLEPSVKDLDPVILPPVKYPAKTNYWVWIIGALVVAKWQKLI